MIPYRGNHSEMNNALVAAFGVGKCSLRGEQQKQEDGSFVEVGTVTILDPAVPTPAVEALIATHNATDWPAFFTAKAAREAADQQEFADAKSDAQIQAMLNRTPTQISTFIDSNVTDPGVRQVMKVFARILVAVARRVMR